MAGLGRRCTDRTAAAAAAAPLFALAVIRGGGGARVSLFLWFRGVLSASAACVLRTLI